MSTPVFYHSGMAGFPAGNTRTAGGFIAVLDSCLVNGANLQTAVSLTQTGGVATLAFPGNHNFAVGDRVLVDGGTPTAYNGLQDVTAITASSASFAVDSGTASPATGTVTVKHPGAGWVKSWADGNKAAYRSATSDGGVGAYMQIEDDNYLADAHLSFRWCVCEGHTGLNSATRLVTDLRRFSKTSTSTQWWCVADDRMAYIHITGVALSTPLLFVFGELNRLSPTDNGAWVFPSSDVVTGTTNTGRALTYATRTDSASGFPFQVLKTWSGVDMVANVSSTLLGAQIEEVSTATLGTAQRSGSSPNPLTGAVELLPVRGIEQVQVGTTGGCALTRGTFPGVYHPTGRLNNLFFNAGFTGMLAGAEINGVPKRIMVARVGDAPDTQLAFDLTGPWR